MASTHAGGGSRDAPVHVSTFGEPSVIRTPDHRVRVFISSTLLDLTAERAAAREAITRLRLAPVMFEQSARPHPPRELYRAYLDQSHVFVGIYWQSYGWVAPEMEISGLEDEYCLATGRPKLLYVKEPAAEIEPRLLDLLERIRNDNTASYKIFRTPKELRELLENDLAVLLTERFERATWSTAPAAMPSFGGTSGGTSFNTLPVERGPLVGRAAEVATTEHLLRSADVGLVTLTGPAGTGKTRLSVHVASRIAHRFEHGVCFVPLAPVLEASHVPSTIARSLELRETGDRAMDEALLLYLREKHLLLVLDNFEHVLDAAPYVSALLRACPRLKVLATSRAALRLRDEHELPVPPLALPQDSQYRDVPNLSRVGAVELFTRRAREALPDFRLTVENGPAVAEICRRLDGLPLAIELAAARIKLLPPRAMLMRLERRLPLLTGGARDLPARQQTLRGAISWSYDLLNPAEQCLFRRLSVFPGGAAMDAARAACCDQPELELLDNLEGLVHKSLLRQSEDPDGEPRFVMLQTFLEYGLEKLAEEREVEPVRTARNDYYRALAKEAEPELRTARGTSWLNRLESEHDNLRAVLHSTVEREDAAFALELTGALWRFWHVHSHFQEGRRWLELALALPQAANHNSARAKALVGLGSLARDQGDLAVARKVLEESCAISRELQDKRGLSLALHTLSTIPLFEDDYDEAESAIAESLGVAREVGDPEMIAASLNNLGVVAIRSGAEERVREIFEEVLTIYRNLGDERGVALALSNLALAALVRQDFSAAAPLLAESLTLFAQLKDKDNIVASLMGMAGVAVAEGDPEKAAHLCGAAEALRDAIGAPISSFDRGPYELTVSRIRAHLDASAAETAWAVGRVTPLDAVVREALTLRDSQIRNAPSPRARRVKTHAHTAAPKC